jgi:hypothetical protein
LAKDTLSRLFRWNLSTGTLVSAIAGLIVLALSVAMIPTRDIPWIAIILRDIGMIFLVGILFPLLFIHRSGSAFAEFGLTFKRWYVYSPISLALGGLLLLLLISETPPVDVRFDVSTGLKVAYILLAGIFEVVFFYGFQRTLFERGFGIVPGIILAALFYSYHHAGFQPEFRKLFFVGVMYASVFRIGNSMFLIYPFFWGVGGCYDVLVQSQAVSTIMYPGLRSLYLGVLIWGAVIWIWRERKRRKVYSNESNDPL